jgi:hypothetical protein
MRYEALRRAFLLCEWQGMGEDWARFSSLGSVGLLPFEPVTEYVVEVYAAPVRVGGVASTQKSKRCSKSFGC